MSVRLIVLATVVAVGLSACGKRGTLERPPPMWGTAPAAQDPERKAPTKYERGLPAAPESQNTSPRTNPLDGPNRGPDAGANSPQNWLQQNQPHTR